ncbi:MAG: 1,4-dihydroxy-2-naphthoate polyprenyltransferase [Reinekea sp.]
MSTLNSWWMASRPKTLPASVSPVLLGSALAWQSGRFQWPVLWLALICALALQVTVNLANDFFDARNGVDGNNRIGPLRATQSGLISARAMKFGLSVASAIAIISGLALVFLSHWILFVCGILSMLAVFAYSAGPYPLASHALGEVTVLIFFGWLAVGGTYFAHAGDLSLTVFFYGTVAGLLSAAIMLVNNLRDIPTDSSAGKMTLAVVLGDMASRQLYICLLVAALLMHLLITLPFSWSASLVPVLVLTPCVYRLSVNVMRCRGAVLNHLLSSTAKLLMGYCVLSSLMLLF